MSYPQNKQEESISQARNTQGNPVQCRSSNRFRLIVLITLVLALGFSSCSTTSSPDTADGSSAKDNGAEQEDSAKNKAEAEIATATPEATPTPEPTATPEPTPTPEYDADTLKAMEAIDILMQIDGASMSEEQLGCSTKNLDPEILKILAASGKDISGDDLDIDQLVDISTESFKCAPEFAQKLLLTGEAQGIFSAEASRCLGEKMSTGTEESREVIRVLMDVGAATKLPPASIKSVAEVYNECVPLPEVEKRLIGPIQDEVGPNAFDKKCVSEAFAQDGMTLKFWTVLIEHGGDIPDEKMYEVAGDVFECLKFSSIFASAFEQQGAEISQETLACIDTETASIDRGKYFSNPGANPELEVDIQTAVFTCLSPEELAALAGSN